MATNAQLAALLLRHTADFFSLVGDRNPDSKEDLEKRAEVLRATASLVEADPTGEAPIPIDMDET